MFDENKVKIVPYKDLFQLSTIVSVGTRFGGQMGMAGGGDCWAKLTSELEIV